ncbi:MAG: DNA primase [Rickettsiales bacterium]|nr:MAG: DNA primase [Rickettsiales bacterium]
MKLSTEFYNHLRDYVSVSEIVRQKIILTKKMGEYVGICPFHNEKTPSFTVSDAKKFYHCFGCGAHGDVIRFVSETNGIGYKEAAIKIANEKGIELPKMSASEEKKYEEADQIHNILELACQFFTQNLNNNVLEYLATRKIDPKTIQDFSIGYAPGGGVLEKFLQSRSFFLKDLLKCGLFGKKEDGRIYEVFNKRIMFPIRNTYNKIVAFGGRAIGDAMPKYINSPETVIFKKSEHLFGENIATGHFYKNNHAILVEGYMDVIALHQAGFKQTVASLGTAVTENHIQKLWRACDEIIVCLDGDDAGIRASARTIELITPHVTANKSVSFIKLPIGLDPDDLIKTKGNDAFNQALIKRYGLSEMIWKIEFDGKEFKTPEPRALLEQKLDIRCSLIKDKTLQANFKRYFKEMIWHNIVKNKKTDNSIAPQFSSEVTNCISYNEMEVAENAICAFIIKFYDHIDDILDRVHLQNFNLNEFKDWIIEFKSNSNENKHISLEDAVKKTRFYNIYLLLSQPNNLFFNIIGSTKKDFDKNLFFEWLCKKHYLLILKQEYVNASKNSSDITESRSASYLKEIQKVSKELDQLSENFIS